MCASAAKETAVHQRHAAKSIHAMSHTIHPVLVQGGQLPVAVMKTPATKSVYFYLVKIKNNDSI